MALQPTFSGFLKASGQAEVWDDTDTKKFQQFGWRTTTNESGYSNGTLMGNWSEERFDIKSLKETKPLPSQYSGNFNTTYKHSYTPSTGRGPAASLKYMEGCERKAFPGHQPILDTPLMKHSYTNVTTTSQDSYRPPHES